MNDNKNENKTRPAGLFIGIAAVVVFLALGIAMWVEGPRHGWSRDTRIIIELSLFSALLVVILLVKYFEVVLLWIASLRASRWFARYDVGNHAASVDHDEKGQLPGRINRAAALRNALRARHGWRWRYRERWILIVGDEPLVKRLAPGLTDTGYALTDDTVLLYAKQTNDTLDTGWLDQIRRLRRRRPVDAVVVVTGDRSAPNAPFDPDNLAQRLSRHSRALGWAAPAYLLNAPTFDGNASGPQEAIGFTWANARITANDVDASLQDLAHNLADAGVVRLVKNRSDRYPAELSEHIAKLHAALSGLVLQTAQSRFWRNPVHGLLFAPLSKARAPVQAVSGEKAEDDQPATPQQHPVWQAVAEHSRKVYGRRVGFSVSTTAAWIATALVGGWIVGTLLSGLTNRATIQTAAHTLTKLSAEHDPTRAMQRLDSLDKQIDTLETRQRHGAPWITRFGLNRDGALLAALWPGYANAAGRILVGPIRQKLEERLRQLASSTDVQIASGGNTQVQAAYDTLKAYLMLAQPEQAVPAFLTQQLVATAVPQRPVGSSLSPGTWEDLR